MHFESMQKQGEWQRMLEFFSSWTEHNLFQSQPLLFYWPSKSPERSTFSFQPIASLFFAPHCFSPLSLPRMSPELSSVAACGMAIHLSFGVHGDASSPSFILRVRYEVSILLSILGGHCKHHTATAISIFLESPVDILLSFGGSFYSGILLLLC